MTTSVSVCGDAALASGASVGKPGSRDLKKVSFMLMFSSNTAIKTFGKPSDNFTTP
jgi:hypothetical protein